MVEWAYLLGSKTEKLANKWYEHFSEDVIVFFEGVKSLAAPKFPSSFHSNASPSLCEWSWNRFVVSATWTPLRKTHQGDLPAKTELNAFEMGMKEKEKKLQGLIFQKVTNSQKSLEPR